jgi:hypothetical protein
MTVRYIPTGAAKVASKKSKAVAYVYERGGKFLVIAYYGEQSKPLFHYAYKTAAQRDARVAEFFQRWAEIEAEKAARKAEDKAWKHSFKVGDLFRTCWGYDQTNVEWFECVGVKGTMLEVREIAQEREVTAWEQGKCVPVPGAYISPVLRRKAVKGGFRVESFRFASYQQPTVIAGVKVYDSARWSSYA